MIVYLYKHTHTYYYFFLTELLLNDHYYVVEMIKLKNNNTIYLNRDYQLDYIKE